MTGNSAVTASFFPFSKGEMLSVFFILCFLCLVRRLSSCLVRRLLSFFATLLFLGSLSEKIFGSELLFVVVLLVLCFFDGFLPMFLLYFWRLAPESV